MNPINHIVHLAFNNAGSLTDVSNALRELNTSTKLGLREIECNFRGTTEVLKGLEVQNLSKFLNRLGDGKPLVASNGVNIQYISNAREWRDESTQMRELNTTLGMAT